MANWVKLVAVAAIVVGGAVLALALMGIWPRPSEADQQRARILFAHAEAQARRGDQDGALTALTESIDLAPQIEALRLRASIYVARREFDAAKRDLDKLINRRGGMAQDYSMRCWLRARGDQLSSARDDCDRALEIDSTLASAFGNRGIVGLRQHYYGEAWDDFNEALRAGGSDQWVAWRVFGRGAAAFGLGRVLEGRQDIELALRSNPTVVADYAEFGIGNTFMPEFDEATYAAAERERGLISYQQYLYIYPNGAHAGEARAQIESIYANMAEDEAAGRASIRGFSLAQVRGSGPPADSFGAIGISRSTPHVAFATDYATAAEAELAAANACNGAGARDCEAFAFRNVCAALALSPSERSRGMVWSYARDDAISGAIAQCRNDTRSRDCVPVHSQCTPTPTDSTPVASPE